MKKFLVSLFLTALVSLFIVSCNSSGNNEDSTQSVLGNTDPADSDSELIMEAQDDLGVITNRQWILTAVEDASGERFPVFQESDFQFTLFLSTATGQFPELNNSTEFLALGYYACDGQSFGGAYRLDGSTIRFPAGLALDGGGCERLAEVQAATFEEILFSQSPVFWSLNDRSLVLTTDDNSSIEFGLQAATTEEGQLVTTYFDRFLMENDWYIDSYTDRTGNVSRIPREAEWRMEFSSDAVQNTAVMTTLFGPCLSVSWEYFAHDVDIRQLNSMDALQSSEGGCAAQAELVLPALEQAVTQMLDESTSLFSIVGENSTLTLLADTGDALFLSR